MQVIRTHKDLRYSIECLRNDGKHIALVPTMGALHEGHMALISEALKHAGHVIVSIFVNPAQFRIGEDFDTYPRDEESDIRKLENMDISVLYIPAISEIYPDGVKKSAVNLEHADILEGKSRPGFFEGVATVVSILFNHCDPDIAVFGEKDFQQLHIIRQIAGNIRIMAVPTVRDYDGLALSSRNKYLSADERKIAPELYKTLCNLKNIMNEGRDMEIAVNQAKRRLTDSGFGQIDYLEVRDENSFKKATTGHNGRILAAVRLGNTRLIDNIPV